MDKPTFQVTFVNSTNGCFFVRRNWMLRQPLLYSLVAKASSFFYSPSTLTQSVRLPMVTYSSFCSPCMTCRTLCLTMGHQMLPPQPLTREERISRQVKIILSMCLCPNTQLDCNQFTMTSNLHLYMSGSRYFLLMVKTLIKKQKPRSKN